MKDGDRDAGFSALLEKLRSVKRIYTEGCICADVDGMRLSIRTVEVLSGDPDDYEDRGLTVMDFMDDELVDDEYEELEDDADLWFDENGNGIKI